MREYRVIKDYKSLLSIKETEDAIKFVRDNFEHMLCKKLNLSRVSAPLFVLPSRGKYRAAGVRGFGVRHPLTDAQRLGA